MPRAPIHRFETVTSTNDIAKELAADGAAEGTLVVAAEQTKGRGSRGRCWISPLGVNLLASIILRPEIAPDRYGELAFVAAIAVARAVTDTFGLDCRVKWPNDVRVGGKKVAGILVEASHGAAVVGIGVNVNSTVLPEEISRSATSLTIELNRRIEIDEVLNALRDEMDAVYAEYSRSGFGPVLSEWSARQDTLGQSVTIETGGERITGTATGIDERGGLIVQTPDGLVSTVNTGIIVDLELS